VVGGGQLSLRNAGVPRCRIGDPIFKLERSHACRAFDRPFVSEAYVLLYNRYSVNDGRRCYELEYTL
jgi:hypothetical protein